MKTLPLLIAAAFMAPSAASASTIFSDTLQTTLSPTKWAANGSGQIVASPAAGGNALHFANLAAGGDLFSVLIAGPGTYTISFDYLCGTAGGCGGFLGLAPGSTTTDVGAGPGNDAWMWTDTPAAYPTAFTGTGNGFSYTPISFTFTVTSPGQWGLKLEDFSGGGTSPTAGDAYFRNLSVAAVPEASTWAMLILGFGFVGAAVRRRRRDEDVALAA